MIKICYVLIVLELIVKTTPNNAKPIFQFRRLLTIAQYCTVLLSIRSMDVSVEKHPFVTCFPYDTGERMEWKRE